MKAEGRYVALRGGAGAETGRGAPTSPFQHPGGALVEGVTAAAVICEHRPARKHKRACGAERRAVQEAHLRCASPRNSKFHGHLHLKTIEGAGAGGRRVLIRGVLSALEAEHSRRKRGKVEGSPRYGWAAESPSSGPSQGAGGGSPLQGPNAALKHACGDVRLLVALPPAGKAHVLVCTQLGHRDGRVAAAAAAASAAAAATPSAAAETAADATNGGSKGKGDKRRWSRRVAAQHRALYREPRARWQGWRGKGEWRQELTAGALPSGRANRGGSRGER